MEPDASTASYFFAAAAVSDGRTVTVPGLGGGSLQGDVAFARVLDQVETGRDWIQIWPGRPAPARIACHRDHRIVMSFSVTGLLAPRITLDDPGCVKKTFPEFHTVLDALRREWRPGGPDA